MLSLPKHLARVVTSLNYYTSEMLRQAQHDLLLLYASLHYFSFGSQRFNRFHIGGFHGWNQTGYGAGHHQ